MGEEAEGIEVEVAVPSAAIALDGEESTRRRRGRPKGRGRVKGRGRSGDRAFASPAMRPCDEGRGVAAGTMVLRERRPAPATFRERDTDDEDGEDSVNNQVHESLNMLKRSDAAKKRGTRKRKVDQEGSKAQFSNGQKHGENNVTINDEVLEPAKKQMRGNAGKAFTPKKLKEEEEEENKVPSSKNKSCDERYKNRKKMLTGENARMCHQCQRNDKERVVWCKSCNNKRFCVPCIKQWYPDLPEDEFAAKCPYCRKNCNCKACLRMRGVEEPPKKEISEENQVRYACHIVRLLLPWLRELHQEQMEEKKLEANIRGVSMNEMKLEQADCDLDERVHCSRCRTSIVDFHRSCKNCLYDLCLICCRELRNGEILGGEDLESVQYEVRGKEYVFGEPQSNGENQRVSLRRHKDTPFGESYNGIAAVENPNSPLLLWKAKSNGSIPCPPKELGGCSGSVLELKCMFPENMLAELEDRADNIVRRIN